MLEWLLPHQVAGTIYDIDLKKLQAEGISGIICDLDNTLVGARVPSATPELADWLERVRSLGFRVIIVSNNRRTRVSRFAEPHGIPYIYSARKPVRASFRKALNLLGLAPEQVVVIGDQLLTDVLGAKRTGLRVILVKPIAPADESVFTRVNRMIERVAHRRLKRRGLWPKEDQL
jgi:HAD superfamily (subfamily IIIA) phosphatase, TIGR01668